MRVAIMRAGSPGAEAIVNVRFGPFESVSGGSTIVTSMFWPALKSNPAGRSKWKAIVPSATLSLLVSFEECTAMPQ